MVPVLVFCGCVFLALQLWQRQAGVVLAVGEVATAPVDIVPLIDGTLVALEIEGKDGDGGDVVYSITRQELDEVARGEPVARMDDAPARAALATLQSEVARLGAELTAVRTQILVAQTDRRAGRTDDQISQARRLVVDIETQRLNMLDRKTRIESGRIQLARHKEKLAILKKLVERGVENEYTQVDAKLRHDTLAEEITQDELALTEAVASLKAAEARQKAYQAVQVAPLVSDDLELATRVEPIRKAIDTQNLRIAELTEQIKRLRITAPVSGQIMSIARRPGQAVRAGEIIMTLAPRVTGHIISYVPEDRLVEPTVGMPVKIKVRSMPPKVVSARIDKVGTQVQAIPPHQLRDPNVPQWGLPVRIAIPAELALRPGQLVDILYTRE